MSKIMFFAHDPGGANAIKPLAAELAPHHEVLLFADGPALKILKRAKELAPKALQTLKPQLLITGTSANDFTERRLWAQAKELKIKSLAILDHWVNYGIRFSAYGLLDAAKFKKECAFLPDYISVMDDYAKEEMIKDGVPAGLIHALGNPHFEQLRKSVAPQKKDNKKFTITFASEPYTEDYGSGPEKQALKDLLDFSHGKDIAVKVRLHPKEDLNKYSAFAVEAGRKNSSQEDILGSDLIVSMTSMLLIEACLLGKPVLSYQPGAQNPGSFILVKRGTVPFINNKADFFKYLEGAFKGQTFNNFNVNLNGIKNNLDFINKILMERL